MQRFLIVMCIVTALFIAAFKPARSAPTGTEKGTAATIAATENTRSAAHRSSGGRGSLGASAVRSASYGLP